MRILHLCFELHTSAEKDDFARENQEVYRPFLAFLERNAQKWSDFKISLVVSGLWLERAEKFDSELVSRLRKLVRAGKVELIATTFYHSLANFYDLDEEAEQIEHDLRAVEDLLGKKPRVLALPELVYNDKIGRMAEQMGFAAMLAGGAPVALDWRSANHVYEAVGCEYLRLIFPNTRLSKIIARGEEKILAEKKVDDEEKSTEILSVVKFRKLLDLDCLRGGLVTLFFNVRVFAERRQEGVAKFFDDLVSDWQENGGNRLVGVTEACVTEAPTAEIAVTQTVNWREDKRPQSAPKFGLVVKQNVEYLAPDWLNDKASRKLYGLRREVLAAEDERLLEAWRELTAIELMETLPAEEFGYKLEELKKRATEVKKSQAVEISRVYTKRHDRGLDKEADADEVTEKAPETVVMKEPARSVMVHGALIDDVVQVVPVKRVREPEAEEAEEAVSEEAEAPKEAEIEKPKRKIQKIIKRLVIE